MRKGDFNQNDKIVADAVSKLKFQSHRVRKGDFNYVVCIVLIACVVVSISSSEKRGF